MFKSETSSLRCTVDAFKAVGLDIERQIVPMAHTRYPDRDSCPTNRFVLGCIVGWVVLSVAYFSFTENSSCRPSGSMRGLEFKGSINPGGMAPSAGAVQVRRPTAEEDEPIHIMMTYCLEQGLDRAETAGLTSLRSLLAARSTGSSRTRKYVVHLLVDTWAEWLLLNNSSVPVPPGKHMPHNALETFQQWYGDVLAHIDTPGSGIELLLHPEESIYSAAEDALGREAVQVIDRDGFKRCAPLRLMTPFYAPIRADRVIYLDLDTLVLCDIEELWRLFGTWSPTQWFGASRSGDPLPPAKCVDLPTVVFSTLYMDSVRICSLQPSQRGLPTAPQYIFEGLNSGALLMWLGRVRIDSKGLLAYWSELRRIVEERGYRAPRFSGVDLPEMVRQHPAGFAYYDQDILNIMSFDWPERFFLLDARWNWQWRPDHDFKSWGSSPICIEHYTGRDQVTPGPRSGLFEYWNSYRRIASREMESAALRRARPR